MKYLLGLTTTREIAERNVSTFAKSNDAELLAGTEIWLKKLRSFMKINWIDYDFFVCAEKIPAPHCFLLFLSIFFSYSVSIQFIFVKERWGKWFDRQKLGFHLFFFSCSSPRPALEGTKKLILIVEDKRKVWYSLALADANEIFKVTAKFRAFSVRRPSWNCVPYRKRIVFNKKFDLRDAFEIMGRVKRSGKLRCSSCSYIE